MGFLLFGLMFLAHALLGIPINGKGGPEEWWAPAVIGGPFTLIGVLLLLGRRGITLDAAAGTVALWWGLPMPLWVRRHSLAGITSVTLAPKAILDSDDRPLVAWQVALGRSEGEALTIFASAAKEEAQAIAAQIAKFLKCEVAGAPSAPWRAGSGGLDN